jgi:hypothetical protein
MASIEQQVDKIVKRLEKKVADYVRAKRLNKVLKPYPPASPKAIAAVEKYLGLSLPPSYRAFLELHNGYDCLAYPGHMLPVEAHMPGSEWHDTIVDWKKMTATSGGAEVLDGIFIAYLDSPNNWAFLDPNKPRPGGELTVVKWLNADTAEYADVVEFLENRLSLMG